MPNELQPQIIPQQQPLYQQPQGYYPQTYYNNPYLANQQQRLQQMELMYPHLAQNNYPVPQQMQQQSTALKGRAVTGIDEAKASAIDFDGSVFLFTDLANGNIYTKKIGLNGSAEFDIYTLQPKEVKQVTPTVITPSAQPDLTVLMNRIENLETKIKQYEGMILNVNKSNTNNAAIAGKSKSNGNVTASFEQQSGIGAGD